jgi:peptidoglycan-N-acetylmuramic acid deacetylase
MKKYRFALLTVFATALISLKGSTYINVAGVDKSNEVYSVFSSIHTEPSKHGTEVVTPIPSSTPSSGSVLAEIPAQEVQATPTPSSESVLVVSPTPEPEDTPTPSPESVSTISTTPTPQVEDVPEFIYPIRTFDDDTRICITFDDGGDRRSVKNALEVLKKHEVQCTFFVVGKYLKANEELWKQAIEDGHIICNHTQNHKWLTELKNEEAKKEILEWESTASEVLGQDYLDRMKQESPFIRLPGGAGNESKRILRIVSELGYIPIGWNIESYYAVLRHHNLKTEPLDPIAEEVFAHITKKAKGGSIVLLHFNPYDVAKLDEIITEMKAKELTMHLLSECIE